MWAENNNNKAQFSRLEVVSSTQAVSWAKGKERAMIFKLGTSKVETFILLQNGFE